MNKVFTILLETVTKEAKICKANNKFDQKKIKKIRIQTNRNISFHCSKTGLDH